jgi:hypothetical protein
VGGSRGRGEKWPKQCINIGINELKKKTPGVLLQQVFYISGKQGGAAIVLREGCDIVTRET